ncbi:hypothetical protein LPJ66_007376 [Kickxella alabastrina]|uniref:Uncharacterized protein n=1 Tax=Kickxella alabastrina TaxID=61397 RepID=A0ACC1IAH1_9FUNG|nr:hypothetical protein LPJ66_007376 [Kickxella alabastrina]
MSVNVSYGTLKTSTDNLRQAFEQVGKVWDIIPVESKITGRLLKQAIVRFYDGEYQPGSTPDAAPVLPPPTESEVRNVSDTAKAAVDRLDRMEINGFRIRVTMPDNERPTQLHEWYEDMQVLQAAAVPRRHSDLFPINPFAEPPHTPDDDYRQGFMTGFKLGLKDGSKSQS